MTASRSRWPSWILWAEAAAAGLARFMAVLLGDLREFLGQHAAEEAKQFLLVARRQVLPSGGGGGRGLRGRGGAGLGRDMRRLLRRLRLVVVGTSGPAPGGPTGPRQQKSLYPPRQRLPREGGSVGTVFVFRNRRGDRIKLLYWDTDGYVIVYKRLEVGIFRFPTAAEGQASVTVRAAELAMLLDGVDWQSVQRSKRYHRPATATG